MMVKPEEIGRYLDKVKYDESQDQTLADLDKLPVHDY